MNSDRNNLKRDERNEDGTGSKRVNICSDKPRNGRDFGFNNQIEELYEDQDIKESVIYDNDEDSNTDNADSDLRKTAKSKNKIDDDDFSGDEEDYSAMKNENAKIVHISAEVNYDGKQTDDQLTKADLGEGVNGITKFNLKDEEQEGFFDGNGNFVWKKNVEEEELNADPFLSDLYSSGFATINQQENSSKAEILFSHSMHFVRLCSCLLDGETPMKAIQRLGKGNDKKTSIKKSNRHRMAFEIEKEVTISPEQIETNKKCLEFISECCEVLVEEFVNIYEMKKEDIKRLVIWEYKWQVDNNNNKAESEVYGPFNTMQMVEWHELGCFITNPLIRRVENKVIEKATIPDSSAADFDADFDDTKDTQPTNAITTYPWISANTVDYFEE